MTTILEWPGIWLGLLSSPGKTVKNLKSNPPRIIDGISSFGLLNFIIGILLFLFAAVLSVLASSVLSSIAPDWAAGGLVMMLVFFFVICVIVYPIGMILGLFVVALFFKAASLILKGKSSFGQLYGLLGVVGSAYMIVMLALLLIIYLPMIALILLFTGSLAAMSLIYLLMGVAYLVTMPFMQMVTAIFFDMLADLEKVSIYRAGAMTGLAFGLVMFVIMAVFFVFMFLVGSFFGGTSRYESFG